MSSLLSPELVSASAVTVGALAILIAYARRDSRPIPPGPRSLPIIGNLLNMPSQEQWLVYQEWSRKYGSLSFSTCPDRAFTQHGTTGSDIVHMNVFGTDILVVNSAEAASALFGHKSAIYSDRPRMPMLGELIGLGWHFGFMPHGEDWRIHRKIFAQEFTATAVEGYQEQELKWTKIFLQNLIATPQNFMQHIQHMASGLALEISFGLEVQPSGQPDPFIAAATQAVEALTETGLFGTYLVDFLPSLKYFPAWLPFGKFRRQANKWRISPRRDYVPSIGSKILMSDEASNETAVRQATAAMFANGSAATVSALTTFILAMRLYPEVQAKARREIEQVVSGRLPSYSDEASLPYITAIIREIGRWNPVVPLSFPHKLTTDDNYNGYYLKAGSVVFPNAWAILHDPTVYPEPHIFKPERFLTNDGKLNPNVKDPEAPWGFGRRICPGRKMANSTMFITIASILATFEITAAIDDNGRVIKPSGEYGSGMLRYPKPFKCNIKPRSREAAALISED
ncbi:Cytochrome P450 [Mycena sanguinolenta]|uniref:Cytochrome P450 n=1 Tax=Mycena sanguinolenta TaxID=230812 RepID=A0A8H6XQ93_9AGAR|nr:Cytochrome P450 [Mycena sanguinolenta]